MKHYSKHKVYKIKSKKKTKQKLNLNRRRFSLVFNHLIAIKNGHNKNVRMCVCVCVLCLRNKSLWKPTSWYTHQCIERKKWNEKKTKALLWFQKQTKIKRLCSSTMREFAFLSFFFSSKYCCFNLYLQFSFNLYLVLWFCYPFHFRRCALFVTICV